MLCMQQICITASSTAEDLEPIAICVSELFGGLPVTARSKNKHGVRVENGKVISRDYTGPMLERAIVENAFIKERSGAGVYKGIPVTVSPIRKNGEAIAAIGVVDVTGSLDLKTLMDQYSKLENQIGEQ
jgi:hypothetical protein